MIKSYMDQIFLDANALDLSDLIYKSWTVSNDECLSMKESFKTKLREQLQIELTSDIQAEK